MALGQGSGGRLKNFMKGSGSDGLYSLEQTVSWIVCGLRNTEVESLYKENLIVNGIMGNTFYVVL